MTASPARFRDRTITLRNGSVGRTVEVASASPVNFHQAISRAADLAPVTIDGKLFLPPANSPAKGLPLVIVVPGSLGVAGSHLAHADTITSAGIAAFVLDPFGARGVASTVAKQTQFSFAASAYDVLAAFKVMSACGAIDASRIGAQGAGGSASLRLFPGAAHSFDRATPVERIAEAAVSPAAPTAYIADDGAFVHPLQTTADPELRDRDLMVYALKAGYGIKGATLGTRGDEAEHFRADMIAFWRRTLLG